MLAKINSCAIVGLEGQAVEVEVDLSAGLPGIIVVGLPDTAVQESKERVRSAIKNSGATYPTKRITINLAPADLKKEGPAYDLPIAVGILLAAGEIEADLSGCLFLGELALDGTLRHTNGILPAALFAREKNYKRFFVPKADEKEVGLVDGIEVIPLENLRQLIDFLAKKIHLTRAKSMQIELNAGVASASAMDMSHIKGQEHAKRALEIAAAGGHNVLMSGPPGTGKTLLARSTAGILPRLTKDEALEITKIYSVAGMLPKDKPLITERPFRTPHHSASGPALVGGGQYPKPGEISLAHRGVLFLDELPEFPRGNLENLRQPLEDGIVTISRAHGTLTFPAQFTLIASMNPCPCGYLSDPEHECTCSPSQIIKYQKKISGPLLDRIDLHLEVPRIKFEKLSSDETAETSTVITERVEKARAVQAERFKDTPILTNSEMNSRQVRTFCPLPDEALTLLKTAVSQFSLSARSYYKILKVSRTIADLANETNITAAHIAEALQFRSKIDHSA